MIGIVAGTLGVAGFIPQVIKVWRNKSAKDISLSAFLILSGGSLLWILYGMGINSMPLIASNTAVLLLVAAIAVMKLIYK